MSQNESATGMFEINTFGSGVELVEPAEDTYHFVSFANVTAFDTEDGLVLVDTGLPPLSPHIAAALREHTDSPVHTAIYTHGHVDHAYGLGDFLIDGQEPPTVIAHEAMPDRFDRYARTEEHNEVINGRQMVANPDTRDNHNLYEGDLFGWPDHPPTTLYSDEMTVTVGDLTFEIHHDRGETDDATWLYCPERDVLCTGDLMIAGAPNAGNPQKVQRYPWEWADALREMAAVGAGTMVSGHGEPIVDDADEVEHRLLRSAEYLETIVEQTVEALNDGSPPHVDIVHEVDLPDPDEPWLRDEYDCAEFIARNVIRYYGGWWTGRPSELKPARRDVLADEIADLAGDPETLAERAQERMGDGEERLACHLADYALEAAPENEAVQEAVATVYAERSEGAEDMMSANIFASARLYAEQGRRFR